MTYVAVGASLDFTGVDGRAFWFKHLQSSFFARMLSPRRSDPRSPHSGPDMEACGANLNNPRYLLKRGLYQIIPYLLSALLRSYPDDVQGEATPFPESSLCGNGQACDPLSPCPVTAGAQMSLAFCAQLRVPHGDALDGALSRWGRLRRRVWPINASQHPIIKTEDCRVPTPGPSCERWKALDPPIRRTRRRPACERPWCICSSSACCPSRSLLRRTSIPPGATNPVAHVLATISTSFRWTRMRRVSSHLESLLCFARRRWPNRTGRRVRSNASPHWHRETHTAADKRTLFPELDPHPLSRAAVRKRSALTSPRNSLHRYQMSRQGPRPCSQRPPCPQLWITRTAPQHPTAPRPAYLRHPAIDSQLKFSLS